ncbi:MAG TPA: 2-amino-4-hydroxy-6-hydroxymethyldihydropteridine diphosphokinase [Acetobacteraceae bacterium]|nr:2-amino-4-hydroxy-6-hydroxymethyldihydropteridine diphosphokinase [Acetobacteraceae bacterium]
MINLHLIALGANLPGPDGTTPLQTCERALRRLAALPGLELQARSRWFATAPVPPSDQPHYINGVARLAGAIAPAELLARLQRIEAEFGRARGVANAARTLDLDIIDMAGLVRDAPDPILPHPRAHQRSFVLLPLRDVAPDWVHPRTGETVTSLLQQQAQRC